VFIRCQVWPRPAPPQTFILWSYGGGGGGGNGGGGGGGGGAYPVMSRAEAITAS